MNDMYNLLFWIGNEKIYKMIYTYELYISLYINTIRLS